MPVTVKIKNARLAFPQIWEPATVGGEGKPAFSCALLLPPDHADIDAINEAIEAVAVEKWGAKAKSIVAQLRAQDRVCLHNGDLKANYDGYAGNFFVNCRGQVRPTILDRNKTPLTQADGKPYGGCYVNASIDVWTQDNQKFGKRINASLRGLQFMSDGDSFSAGSAADPDEFDDLGVDDGEEALA